MLVLCIDNNFTDVHQGIHLVCRHTNEWRVRKKTEPDCFLLILFFSVASLVVGRLLHLVEIFFSSFSSLIHRMITSFCFLFFSNVYCFFFLSSVKKTMTTARKKCIRDNETQSVWEKENTESTILSPLNSRKKNYNHILH